MTPEASPSREDRTLRLTIVAFAGVMLVLILLSIQLSMLQVPSASLVYGSPEVWRGHTAGFRVISVHPERIRPIQTDVIRLTLVDQTGLRWEKEKRRRHLGEFLIDIPQDLQKDARLGIEVIVDGELEAFELPLKPVDSPTIMAGTIHHHNDNLGKPEYQPPNTPDVEIYPKTHHVTAALPNTLTGRIHVAGKPLQARLRMESLDITLDSDANGLFSFDYTPRPSKKPLEIFIGNAPAMKSSVPIKPFPVQLLLNIEHGVMTEGFEGLNYTLHTLPYRRPIHIDTWVGNSLVDISSTIAIGGMHRGEIALTDAPLPTTAVAFRNVIVPEANASWRTFWPGEIKNESHRLTLASWLKSQQGGDPLKSLTHEELAAAPKLLELLMSRFKPRVIGPQLLHSNREARQEAFDVYRVGLRSHINRIFVITISLGLVLCIIWVIRHRRRVNFAMRMVAEEAIEEGEDYDTDALNHVTDNQFRFDLLMIVFWLLLFVYSIYILLARYMRWTWDV